jgi:hypothetical protein
MRDAAEEVKRSPMEGLPANERARQLQDEMHSFLARIAKLVLRILDPCRTRTDASLIDRFELEALPADAQEVGQQFGWVLRAYGAQSQRQRCTVGNVPFW